MHDDKFIDSVLSGKYDEVPNNIPYAEALCKLPALLLHSRMLKPHTRENSINEEVEA